MHCAVENDGSIVTDASSGTADSGAAVARPNTETTGRLGIELADSPLVHQCCNT